MEILNENVPATFLHSWLLGQRAENVYKWFLASLHLPGDVAECGVFTGETSFQMAYYLERNRILKRVHMFDTFEGLPDIITEEEKQLSSARELEPGYFYCNLDDVIKRMAPLRQYVLHKGYFRETFAEFSSPLCFIHADADLYESTVDIISLADKCLVSGGYIVFDDYYNPLFPGVDLAIKRHLDLSRYKLSPIENTIQCLGIKL